MTIVRRLAFIAILIATASVSSAENPVELQRQYKAAKAQSWLTAPAQMSLADVRARLLTFLGDTGSEVVEEGDSEITARTTFATFADPLLVPIGAGVVDLNYQRALYDATGTPIFQLRRITLTQKAGEPVRVQICSRVRQYNPKTNGAPEVRLATRCALAFREWNALRSATAGLFD